MARKEMRFADLVQSSGHPEMVSLWTDPRRDREFQKAVKENRVLTVVQESGTKKKDAGRIGFHVLPHATYMVFPEPLPEGVQARVIGIKYELTADARVANPVTPRRKEPERVPRKLTPSSKTFDVIIRRIAVVESCIRLEARNPKEAAAKARSLARGQPFEVAKAVMKDEVEAVEQVPTP